MNKFPFYGGITSLGVCFYNVFHIIIITVFIENFTKVDLIVQLIMFSFFAILSIILLLISIAVSAQKIAKGQ